MMHEAKGVWQDRRGEFGLPPAPLPVFTDRPSVSSRTATSSDVITLAFRAFPPNPHEKVRNYFIFHW